MDSIGLRSRPRAWAQATWFRTRDEEFSPCSLNNVRSRRRGKTFLISFLIVPMYSTEPYWEWSPQLGSSREWWDSPSSPITRAAPLVRIPSPLSPPLDAIDLEPSLKHLWKNLDLRTSLIIKKFPTDSESKIPSSLSCSFVDKTGGLLHRLLEKGEIIISHERGATLVN